MEVRTVKTAAANYTVYVNTVNESKPYNVFLHGGPGFNCFPEREVMGPRLHGTTNLVWFDQIGCAESPANAPELLSWDRQIDDIIEVTRAVSGPRPVNLFGMCLATLISHSIVERDRSLVNRVLWYSPTIGLTGVLERILRRSLSEGRLNEADLSAEELDALQHFLESPDSESSVAHVAVLLQVIPKIRGFHELYWHDKEKMATYLALLEQRPLAFDVLVAVTLSYVGRGVQEVPSYDGIPVLALYSDEDGITPWAANGQELSKKIPHMKAKRVPKGSHWVQFENTDEVCALTAEFLNS